ncbi:hypothetical protein BDF20DRAFT_712286 [Mycotypha africana]|uniref:uncharacterized protein n=1 Tax=Mycotypha africana TaxID=64632 RepID=UPI0023008F2E|nr:uncharacterized protein BDF20DRAFT_712286 [Mycotypha africana]KAI8971971.1 hypothetical protein BDF20DRAFT_712286 [Mycotypha africana]
MATPMTATTTTGEEMEQQFNQHNLFFYPTATKPAAAASYYPNQYFQPLLDFTLSQHQQEEMAGAKPINNISFPNNTSTTTDFFYSSSFDHLQQSQERLTYSPKPSVSNSNNVFNLNSTTFYPYLYNGSDKSQQQDTTAAAVVAAAALAAVNSTNASTATLEQQQQQFIQLQQFQQQYQLQQHQQQQQQHQVLIAETPHYLQEQQKDLLYSPLTSGMLSGSASSSIIASPQPSLQEPTVYIETEEEEQQGEIREDNILTEQALNDLADLLQQQQRQFDEEEEARLREQEVQPQIPCPASPSIKSCATKSIMATSISSTIDNTTAPDVMSSTPRSPHTLMISQAY